MAPADQTVTRGSAIDLVFTIQNFQAATETFTLEAESEFGWPLSFPERNSIEIQSAQRATVIVRVTPPAGSDESEDTITLTATSQTHASVFNEDSVKVAGAPGEVITPEDRAYRHQNGGLCFVSSAETSSSPAGILVLGAVCLGLCSLIRRRSA